MQITIQVDSLEELAKIVEHLNPGNAVAAAPVVTTEDLKDPAQLELALEGEHPAQTGAKPAQDAAPAPVAEAEDDAAAKRSAAAKKAAATRKANAEKRAAAKKANGKDKIDAVSPDPVAEVIPVDQPLPGSPEARKADRKAREKLTPAQLDAIDHPEDVAEAPAGEVIVDNVTYADVKAAVDSAVIAHGTGPVIGVLGEYEVKNGKELHETQWRSFIADLEAIG